MNYGDRIKIARAKLKITQKDMAKILGISQPYLCAVESGKREANAKVLFGLERIFGIKIKWIAEGTGSIFFNQVNSLLPILFGKKSSRRISYMSEIYSQIENEKVLPFLIAKDDTELCFLSGDEILVDISETEPQNEGIYLFEIDSVKIFKRFAFCSKNNLRNNGILSMKCLGRAVWIIRKL